jgi:predicted Zn-ribbon and HTH transcriptional regulator
MTDVEKTKKFLKNIDDIVEHIDKQLAPFGPLTCKKCEYYWIPRNVGKLPVKCPECQSRKWNED